MNQLEQVTITRVRCRLNSDAGTDTELRRLLLKHIQSLKEKGYTTSQLLLVGGDGIDISLDVQPQVDSHPLMPIIDVVIRDERRR